MFPFQITAQTLKVEQPLGTHGADINHEQAKDCGGLVSRSLNFTLATIILSKVMIQKSQLFSGDSPVDPWKTPHLQKLCKL